MKVEREYGRKGRRQEMEKKIRKKIKVKGQKERNARKRKRLKREH